MKGNRSWSALQDLLVFLLGTDKYNQSVDNNYTIEDEHPVPNPTFTHFLQAGLDALVEDDRERQGGGPYLIRNKFKPELWWSNSDGWGYCSTATIFTHKESKSLDLPIEGLWVNYQELLKEVDRLHGEVELWMSEEMR